MIRSLAVLVPQSHLNEIKKQMTTASPLDALKLGHP